MGTKCAKCFNKLSLPRNKLRIWIFLNDVTDVEDLNLDGLDDEVEITFSSSSQWRGHPKNELAKTADLWDSLSWPYFLIITMIKTIRYSDMQI